MYSINKKVIYAICVSIVFILFAIFYFKFIREDKIVNYPSSGTDIIAFGDSLIVGTGASSESKNFVSLLSKKIGIPIINLGISGNTTADGIARLNQFDKYHPKIVLLLFGGNDYLKKIPKEETFIDLEKIIADLQRRGTIVVLLGIRGGILSDKFDTEFEKLRDKYHTAFVSNVLDGLIADDRYMADSIHPNDIGNQKIADRIYPILLKMLK